LTRRRFLRLVGGVTATAMVGGFRPAFAEAAPLAAANRVPKPAEDLVRELFATLNPWQRQHVVYPWNHGGDAGQPPVRLRIYNTCIGKAIGETYTKAQRELIERILQSMSSGEDGYRRITRNGGWDTNDGILSCGAYIFGDPTGDRKFSFLFTGHHLTVRCDGNSEPNAAFGGPMFYGHIINGYSQRNVFNYQTRSVMKVFDALSEWQRRAAIAPGRPGEGLRSIQLRREGQPMPGIAAADLTTGQKQLIEATLRDILSPYRKEDVDEVMQIVRNNGGMDRIHLAFYQERGTDASQPWSFWRLEGPGFVWNFRVLPHVHTYVNVAALNSAA
jgi:hypothetical protein